MHEEGTLTMAVDEQTPEAQNPGGEQPTEQLAPPVNENFKWYIIHAYSGFERKVRESLESRIQAFGLQNRIGRIMIPTEPVTELRNGKKYTIERVFLPGYVLVEMELDNDLWHVIKNTPRVTGFLGTGDSPVCIVPHEGKRLGFDVAIRNAYCYEWLAMSLHPNYNPTPYRDLCRDNSITGHRS